MGTFISPNHTGYRASCQDSDGITNLSLFASKTEQSTLCLEETSAVDNFLNASYLGIIITSPALASPAKETFIAICEVFQTVDNILYP
jgi:hypothetical protein